MIIQLNEKEPIEIKKDENGKWIHTGKRTDYLNQLVRKCIDMDSWKLSWDIDYTNYVSSTSTADRIIGVLEKKIAVREQELAELKLCIEIVSDAKNAIK